MDKQVSVKKNYIYNMVYQALTFITPFITTPYVSRIMGADGVGISSFTHSIMAYFTMFALLGTMTYGSREISMNRDNKEKTSKLFWEIQLLTFLTSSICLFVWIVLILLSSTYKIYYIALIPTLIGTMVDISWFFTGLEKVKNLVIRNTVFKIIGILCLFIFIKHREQLALFIFLNSMILLIGNLSMWTYLPNILVKIHIRELSIFRHLKQTIIYFIPTIAISIYQILDKTLIGLITKDSYQNGYYEQATKVIQIIKAVSIQALNTVVGVRNAYLFTQKKTNEIKAKIEKSLRYIFLLGAGCAFGIAAVARDFVPVFFGTGYDEVIDLLYLMAPLIIIVGISGCIGAQYLTPCGKQRLAGRLLLVGSAVNLILNIVLIPRHGAKGATIATIIAETIISVLFLKASDGYMTFNTIIKSLWKYVVAGMIMLAIEYFIITRIEMNRLVIKLVAEIISGIIIYIIALLIMRDKMLMEGIGMIKKKLST